MHTVCPIFRGACIEIQSEISIDHRQEAGIGGKRPAACDFQHETRRAEVGAVRNRHVQISIKVQHKLLRLDFKRRQLQFLREIQRGIPHQGSQGKTGNLATIARIQNRTARRIRKNLEVQHRRLGHIAVFVTGFRLKQRGSLKC